MLDKIALPYTCFARLSRLLQESCFREYNVAKELSFKPNREDDAYLLRMPKEIIDKTSLFLTHREVRIGKLINNTGWFSRLKEKNQFQITDALQHTRAKIIQREFKPFSGRFVHDWSEFFEWYNGLEFSSQCHVNDFVETLSGKSLISHIEIFAPDIIAHVKSGNNFYPSPQFNEASGHFERPEILMHKFSSKFTKTYKKNSASSSKKQSIRIMMMSGFLIMRTTIIALLDIGTLSYSSLKANKATMPSQHLMGRLKIYFLLMEMPNQTITAS